MAQLKILTLVYVGEDWEENVPPGIPLVKHLVEDNDHMLDRDRIAGIVQASGDLITQWFLEHPEALQAIGEQAGDDGSNKVFERYAG